MSLLSSLRWLEPFLWDNPDDLYGFIHETVIHSIRD